MPAVPFSPLLLFKCRGSLHKGEVYNWGGGGEQCGPSAVARLHLDSSLSESQACSLHCPDSYLCNWLWVGEMLYHGAAAELPATHSNWDLGAVHLVRCQEGLMLRLVSPNQPFGNQMLPLQSTIWSRRRTQLLRRSRRGVTRPGVIAEKHSE